MYWGRVWVSANDKLETLWKRKSVVQWKFKKRVNFVSEYRTVTNAHIGVDRIDTLIDTPTHTHCSFSSEFQKQTLNPP